MVTLFTEQDMLSFAARVVTNYTKDEVVVNTSELIDWVNQPNSEKKASRVNEE